MFRRKSILSSSNGDDLAPQDSYACREERWTNLIGKLGRSMTESTMANTSNCDAQVNTRTVVPFPADGTAAQASIVDDYFNVLSAPGTRSSFMPRLGGVITPLITSRKGLREWIRLQTGGEESSETKKKYFEKSIRLLNSLVLKMVVTNVRDGKAEMDLAVDPKFISSDNLVVQNSTEEGETIHFVQDQPNDIGLSLGDLNTKYGAMKALGIVAYEMLMRGVGPPIQTFLPSTRISSGGTPTLLLSLDDYDDKSDNSGDREQAKRQRASMANKQGKISAAMVDAGVPYPLGRFVVDLLGGECSDGLLFRSDNSFESFSDVLVDLKQMMDNPEAFIHLAIRDQWRLVFGEKMHGREKEYGMFMDAAARVTGTKSNDALFEALALVTAQNKQQLVFLTGQPGSGKTRLVMESRNDLDNRGWVFLSCKFDRLAHSEPLSIMAGAFDELLKHCFESPRQKQIQNNLKVFMQRCDVSTLAQRVPSLKKYWDGPLEPAVDFEANKEQVHQLFGKLIAVLSASSQAVAFFVDDLQWADAASLDLFMALTKASEPDFSRSSGSDEQKPIKTKVLLIGSYRDGEIHDNFQLFKMLDCLQTSKQVEVTHISVNGFDNTTLNGIVSQSLCLPLRSTKPLTEVILQKTEGIIMHIIEFIGRLTSEKILRHSFVKGWEWDSKMIESCPISSSVAELCAHKMKNLPINALLGLKICSLFGIRIEQRIVDLIEGYDGEHSVDINDGLKVAVEFGLMETRVGSNVYIFAHDIIAQAAFDLMAKDERSQLLQNLVSALIKNATAANEIEAVIFVLVDLINRIKNEEAQDSKMRVLYATMNEKAGRKALMVPDFSSAVRYTESALSLLDDSHWCSHHDLMLSIHQTSVAALYSDTNSNQVVLRERIDLVLKNAVNLDEEFRTRLVWIERVSSSSLQDAIKECHILLERLGEPIDSCDINMSDAHSELIRVQRSIEKKHRLSAQMTETNKIKAMKVMFSLFRFYHTQRSFTSTIVCLRMVELSIKFGCSEDSFFALACFASNFVFFGDIDKGCSWARMTLALTPESGQNMNKIIPAVYLAVYGFVLFWVEPLQSTIDPLLCGCRLGFEYGNNVDAMNSAKIYSTRVLYCGKNINAILKELEVLANKSAQHTNMMSFVDHYLTPMNNILHSLKGMKEQALPSLDVFVSNDELRAQMLNKAAQIDFENFLMLEITHSFIMRNMGKAKMIMNLIEVHITKKPLAFNYVIIDLFVGLTACYFEREREVGDRSQTVNAHESKGPSPISQALKTCDQLKWMISHSEWNFENKYLLLQAECQYTKGELEKASASYKASIQSAKQHKFVNEHAFACELAGYFYKDQGDEMIAMDMFKQAYLAYMQWGAIGKAKLLQESTGIKDVLCSPQEANATRQNTGIEEIKFASCPMGANAVDNMK